MKGGEGDGEREKKKYAQFQNRNSKNTVILCVDVKMVFYRDTVYSQKKKKRSIRD